MLPDKNSRSEARPSTETRAFDNMQSFSARNVKSHYAVDQAAEFIAAHLEYPTMTPEKERSIKRKIDAWIIPLGVFTTTLAAVDKVQLSTAALYDFLEDNRLTGSEFSWLGSILFVGVWLTVSGVCRCTR